MPPQRRAFLEEMVRFAAADDPDVVCLQEVPVWALARLEEWSEMQTIGAVAARPRLVSAELGRVLTDLHHGLLRSALTGQANAILVARRHGVSSPRSTRVSKWWEGERRICQTAQVEGLGLVANFHVTPGLADRQLVRVVQVVESLAGQLPVVLCGDANIRPGRGETYPQLERLGYSTPAPGIDQILARGLKLVSGPTESPHTLNGIVVSDHAPIEAVVQ